MELFIVCLDKEGVLEMQGIYNGKDLAEKACITPDHLVGIAGLNEPLDLEEWKETTYKPEK